MNDNHPTDRNTKEEGQKQAGPLSLEALKAAIERIKDEPFLFVIAIAIVLAGLLTVASKNGSAELRLTILIVAILAGAVILGYYLREGLRMRSPKKLAFDSAGPLRNMHFFDDRINRVVSELERKHHAQGSDLLPLRELLDSLDVLFDRKTFRNESLFHCTLQNWPDRLHTAYQTLSILQAYQSNVRDFGTANQYTHYQKLLSEVDRYCMTMATYLFQSIVDEGKVKKYIGTSEFASHLPKTRPPFKEKKGVLQGMDPSWDKPRQEACTLMDTLKSTLE